MSATKSTTYMTTFIQMTDDGHIGDTRLCENCSWFRPRYNYIWTSLYSTTHGFAAGAVVGICEECISGGYIGLYLSQTNNTLYTYPSVYTERVLDRLHIRIVSISPEIYPRGRESSTEYTPIHVKL